MTFFVSLVKEKKRDSYAIADKYEDAVKNILVTLELESDKNT